MAVAHINQSLWSVHVGLLFLTLHTFLLLFYLLDSVIQFIQLWNDAMHLNLDVQI